MRYFNHRSRSHLHRTGSLFFLLFCVASWAGAQTAQIPSAEVEKRVDMLLAKMMLDALIGGINDFYIQAIPRLGLPALRMSDGPLGVHDYGPTTAYPAGILLAATLIPAIQNGQVPIATIDDKVRRTVLDRINGHRILENFSLLSNR